MTPELLAGSDSLSSCFFHTRARTAQLRGEYPSLPGEPEDLG